jgi:hypothetical protein
MRTLYLNLPLPSRERIEVRGNDLSTFFTLAPLPSKERAPMGWRLFSGHFFQQRIVQLDRGAIAYQVEQHADAL